MSTLRLFLFGAPRLEHDGGSPLRRSKALALLAYLAVRGQPQQRDALLALLWPEFDATSARNNLRRELSLLKSAFGREVLVADRMQVALDPQAGLSVDVAEFEAHIAAGKQHAHAPGELCAQCGAALAAAVQLYGDEFMAGFNLPESPAFDEWQFFQREELRRQLAGALQTLIAWHAATRSYDAALGYARRWLLLDQLHEPAHRELMRLYAWSGRQSAALRQYDECARVLDEELGAEPEAETIALYEEIKSRRVAALPAQPVAPAPAAPPEAAPEAASAAPPAPPPNTLPPATTSFVGRRRELMDILRRCTDPDCRLLTLTGPGGIGKTQLALQTAHRLADGWAGADELADGVLFVPLAAVTTLNGLLSALAAAAQIDFFPNLPPAQQVLSYFRARRMLLVLDNFEQLLDEAEFIGELIGAAPGLRLLITSRAALNLQQEWFHPVEGLSFPGQDDAALDLMQLAQFDAVRLFDQHARRVRADFNLLAAREAVVQLSRYVEGMPLAIELAASWLKVLSVDQVVAALERGLDILTTRERNVAQRHRSVRAVLAQSWELLNADEQHMLEGLSLFSGGFTAEAAQAVAGATLDALASLIERSFVRSEADGRYGMHELLRQYGAEQRGRSPDAGDALQRAHSGYYVEFLAARSAAISGAHQTAVVSEILAEQDNVRAAWQWATAQRDLDAIERAGQTLAIFYEFRGRYREGAAALQQAVDALRAIEASPRRDLAFAARLVDLGWLQIRLGELTAAGDAMEQSYALFEALGVVPLPGQASDPVLGLGMVALLEGHYAVAARHGEAALQRSVATGAAGNRPRALFLLAKAAHAQGDYPAARAHAEDALAAAAAVGHHWLVASLHNELANTLCAMGELGEATHHYQTYSALREAFDDRRGMATALHGLGRIALLEGRYAAARDLFERSLAILREVGAQVDTGLTLEGLACVAAAGGEVEAARERLVEALQLALSSAGRPLLLRVLLSAAEVLLETDKAGWGAEALALVLRHPAVEHELGERALAVQARYRQALAASALAAAERRAERSTIHQFAPQLAALLAVPLKTAGLAPAATAITGFS